MSLFSVIVPIYNAEKFLDNCINSILTQSYKDFEVILVDDGSTDLSSKICDKYEEKDKRVRVIHKRNEGVSKTRQLGVSVAEGEYLVFVDSDDWIDSKYLETFRNTIRRYDPDIVMGGSKRVYKNQVYPRILIDSTTYFDKDKIVKYIFPYLIESEMGQSFYNSVWGLAIKKPLYSKCQVKDTYIDIGEDGACIKPCIYYANSIVLVHESLYFYYMNETSATNSNKCFSWSGPLNIGMHLEKNISMNEFDFQAQVYRNIVHNLFNVCCTQFNQKKAYSQIKADILSHLSNVYYQEALSQVQYKFSWKSLKNIIATMTLKNRAIWLIYLYYLLKNI